MSTARRHLQRSLRPSLKAPDDQGRDAMGPRRARRRVAEALLCLSLAACATAPPAPDTRPQSGPIVPATWNLSGSAATSPATPGAATLSPWPWRDVVRDARLRQVIELALTHNRDLQIARLNIEAARAQYRISDAARAPTVNATAGSTAGRTADDLNRGTDSVSRQYSASLGMASWEVDLWGRLGQLKDAALASYLATEQTQRAVQASLIAEVAQAWLTLEADGARLRLAEHTLEARQRSLSLTDRRKALGAASALDVATARSSVEASRANVATLQAQVARDRNALRWLVGTDWPEQALPQPADPLNPPATEPHKAASTALIDVPPNLPSSVLLQRPDVRSAELQLQAAQANVGAARAALFPTITLTASAGTASNELQGLFAGGNGTWTFAPSVRLPLFDGGASRLAVDKAQVNEQIQLATYDKAIQTAFKEVADALADGASLNERLQAQQALVASSDETLQLTTKRYQSGAESALAVLDAQRALYTAQDNLLALQLTSQTHRLTLYKVLGGQ